MSDCTERFMRYVTYASTSDPSHEDQVPSTPTQFKMAEVIAQDLRDLGLDDVTVDEHAYVVATVPASPDKQHLPALGLCAHIDTAKDAPGVGVSPHIVTYDGKALVAGVVDGKEVVTTAEELPYLAQFVGEDIIVSDGTTLLSADDKAGVAEIIALVVRLLEHPELEHPTLKLAFVPDEEIGHGAELLDLDAFGASWCYTVDGEELGEFNYECFSAAQATVKVTGVMVHPGMAKNIMVNAISVLREFDSMLPAFDRPENTEGYEGFFHPISISGSASEAEMTYLIRDHSSEMFAKRHELMQNIAKFLNDRYGEHTVEVSFKEEYRNMREKFADCPFLIDNALQAYKMAGVEPRIVAVRGGTDGAQLTFRGLPCPNIATGGCLAHSVREFIPVRAMDTTVDILQHLVALFAQEQHS